MAIEGIPPIIHAQLNYLVARSPLSIRVEQMWSSSKTSPWFDRFTLLIPFCLDYLKWDIIFNVQNPLMAPDIVFGPDDESFYPFLLSLEGEGDGNKSPFNSLSDWNNKDPSRLLSLVLQLRESYSAYQRKRVGEVDDDRLKFEISTLSRESLVDNVVIYIICYVMQLGIEMSISSGLDKPEEVRFVVPLLDIDINKLVPTCSWRQQQKIYLEVMYPIGRKYSSASSSPRLKLISTPELRSLFSVEDVKLASWVDGMCLAEYLPSLEETLQKQILEAVALIGVRRQFIEALAPVFGRPLEADPIFCRRAAVLVANGVFTFLVHFVIPSQFPKQQPTLILQSSQHFNSQGIPIRSQPVSDYPWSPRWEESEMAERIFDFLVDEALNFKRYCNEPHLQQH